MKAAWFVLGGLVMAGMLVGDLVFGRLLLLVIG